MRLLVVDVGNTSTAAGLWSDGRVSSVIHCDGSFAEVAAKVQPLLSKAEAFGYVSVVPKVDRKWHHFAQQHKLPFHAVTCADFSSRRTVRCSQELTLDYPHPETIGADRLADAAGALSRYGAPVLVMDFGTALTAAVITADRVWRGGVIAPGFPLMRDYLFERTAQLPRMTLGTGRVPKIGRSTEEAMRFGARIGYRGMVREIVTELKRNFKTDFTLVATGGYAKWALGGLELAFQLDPTLTLYGAGLVCSKRF